MIFTVFPAYRSAGLRGASQVWKRFEQESGGEERCAQFHELLKEVTWEVGIEMRPIEAGLESHFRGLMLPFVSTSLQAVALGSYSI